MPALYGRNSKATPKCGAQSYCGNRGHRVREATSCGTPAPEVITIHLNSAGLTSGYMGARSRRRRRELIVRAFMG